MTLWQMSLSGGLLILAIALIRKLTLDRLPKKTFLILWELAILRLLLPVSIPSPFSIWSFLLRSRQLQNLLMKTPLWTWIPGISGSSAALTDMVSHGATVFPGTTADGAGTIPDITAAGWTMVSGMSADEWAAVRTPAAEGTFSVWFLLWAVGAGICALLFLVSWYRCRREFAASLPVTDGFVHTWLEEHPLPFRRTIRIHQSDRIHTPLTYGILRPVILLPKETDWKDTQTLSWILRHESVHIRRSDALSKLFCTAALCAHWFNPAAYLMYFLLNQDLELACDEAVLRMSGQDDRSAYALALIRMEESRSRLLPFGNSFSRNTIEERITSIMKTRKTSVYTVIAAMALVIGMTAVFVTSAASGGRPKSSIIPGTAFSETEYQQLLALRFDSYERMSVAAYRQKVGEPLDDPQYLDLLERFSQDEQIYGLRDEHEIAAFLHYILNPLTGDRWRTRDFSGYTTSDFPAPAENALLEYVITLSILDSENVTVQQYNDARVGMTDGLHALLQDRTREELSEEAQMKEQIRQSIDQLISRWSTDSLQIDVEYSFLGLSTPSGSEAAPAPDEATDVSADEYEERREYPNATEEDYRSLFALKTDGYQDLSVRDFNTRVLEWANEDSEGCLDRIFCDILWKDCQVPLTPEEQAFAATTIRLSCMENARSVQSHYTGRPEEDPVIGESMLFKQSADGAAFCDLYYQFSYHIADKDLLTIHQRDQAVGGLLSAVQAFWEDTDLEELLIMTEEEVVQHLNDLAREYSTDLITISTREDHVGFETMDERELTQN